MTLFPHSCCLIGNKPIVTWVFDDGFVPTAKLTNDGNFSILSDHLGAPVEAYDAEGNCVWACELDIYGRVKENTGNVDFIPFRYQGQYSDAETGLYYNRFRYYDPAIGQYTQKDPIGLMGNNPTLYAYVGNPNWWIDVFGLSADFIVTPKGTVLPTNADVNLVSTTTPTNQGGRWFQIHNTHDHGGMGTPHTHYPETHTGGGGGSTNQVTRPTTAEDIDFADKSVREGDLRQRENRNDKGGSCR